MASSPQTLDPEHFCPTCGRDTAYCRCMLQRRAEQQPDSQPRSASSSRMRSTVPGVAASIMASTSSNPSYEP